MEYIVIKNHRTEFSNPIILKQGEKVIIGEYPSPYTPIALYTTIQQYKTIVILVENGLLLSIMGTRKGCPYNVRIRPF